MNNFHTEFSVIGPAEDVTRFRESLGENRREALPALPADAAADFFSSLILTDEDEEDGIMHASFDSTRSFPSQIVERLAADFPTLRFDGTVVKQDRFNFCGHNGQLVW